MRRNWKPKDIDKAFFDVGLKDLQEKKEKDKQLFEQKKEIEVLSNMNFWQFRKWKKEQRKK